MKNTDRKQSFNRNFKRNKGENREELRHFILADRKWVQAFLQAQMDMREFRINNTYSQVAY